MTELRWIRGANARPRYVGCGPAAPLYRYVNDLGRCRGVAERIALQVMAGSGSPVEAPPIIDAWTRLIAVVPDMKAALLVYTGFYKDTVLSGVTVSEHSRFVKVFSAVGQELAERRRWQLLLTVLPDSCAVAGLSIAESGVAGFVLIERHRRRPSMSRLTAAAMELGGISYRAGNQHDFKAPEPWCARTERLDALLGELGYQLRTTERRALCALDSELRIAHGDFTPWNVLLSAAGRLTLVDYERVGARGPFNDVWHLHTQPFALAGKGALPTELVQSVSASMQVPIDTGLGWYCVYLVEELLQDASDWVEHERRHVQLKRMLAAKVRLIRSALRASDR